MPGIDTLKRIFFLFLASIFLAGCVGSKHTETTSIEKTSGVGNASNEPAQNLLTEPVPNLKGPKRAVAVGKFDAIGSFVQKYGNWDIGGGVSAMLTSALHESGNFVVLERANLGQVLNELEMKAQKVTYSGSGPSLGKVIGVNFLIYGSITEFGTDDSGGGVSFGLAGGSGLGNLLSSGMSHQSTHGKITMDLRVIDTTTSQVIETYTVSEAVESSGWDFSIGYNEMNFGSNTFVKTPIGQAVRKAINRSVQLIALKANEIPWSAQVVDFDDGLLYINAGKDAGVNIGDKFIIERIVKTFTDPTTGKVIGTKKKEIGGLELTGRENQMSFGNFIPNGLEVPLRGDLVTVLE